MNTAGRRNFVAYATKFRTRPVPGLKPFHRPRRPGVESHRAPSYRSRRSRHAVKLAGMKPKTWEIAGINFDHFHMGDLLRMASEHPRVQVVGISDEQPARMEEAIRKLGISPDRSFTDYRACLGRMRPDIVILCPAASKHGEWVRKVAPYGVHIMVEKPFAASLREADAMIQAMPKRKTLMIN